MHPSSTVVFNSFETEDVDEARAMIEKALLPVEIAVVSAGRPYRCRYEQLGFGPLRVNRAYHNLAVRVAVPDLQGGYTVGFAGEGRMRSRHRGIDTEISTTTAAVHQPVGDIHADSAGATLTYTVAIEQRDLETALSALLGRAVEGPIRFGPSLDLTGPAERSWARLVRSLAEEMTRPDGLATHPMVMQPLTDAVLRGLLLTADHPDREALHQPATPSRSAPVRRAIDAIHTDPAQPFTLSALARSAGVSVRTLQQGFSEQVGTTPMGYLRQVRLACAHDELRAADPTRTGVAAVAHRWGFAHLGRFAAYYRAAYGCPPSDTLHR
ncbi:AraC family transcriptional regulator [Krasilnikovia cinnamomea]|uniref:AraC family transcriptional regulator n=1 Tax=Krasilnikovia cinnamomea TaxID=349313 RepID=A0A4V2G707_9ACTN|nr:AraC family transcriptional regulator [Krasilnikovia cinnamomea]RZU50716.1 AraC family transcriptional regulator [Krasilnikovia cinnamomea]